MKPTGLSAFKQSLLDKPSAEGRFCAVCGDFATDSHHVVQKGMGGVSKEVERRIPRISLCRRCHEQVHRRLLHFAYMDGWRYWRSAEPISDERAFDWFSERYAPIRKVGR